VRIMISMRDYIVRRRSMVSLIALAFATFLLAPAALFAAGYHKAR